MQLLGRPAMQCGAHHRLSTSTEHGPFSELHRRSAQTNAASVLRPSSLGAGYAFAVLKQSLSSPTASGLEVRLRPSRHCGPAATSAHRPRCLICKHVKSQPLHERLAVSLPRAFTGCGALGHSMWESHSSSLYADAAPSMQLRTHKGGSPSTGWDGARPPAA